MVLGGGGSCFPEDVMRNLKSRYFPDRGRQQEQREEHVLGWRRHRKGKEEVICGWNTEPEPRGGPESVIKSPGWRGLGECPQDPAKTQAFLLKVNESH